MQVNKLSTTVLPSLGSPRQLAFGKHGGVACEPYIPESFVLKKRGALM
jgi:hypothetical protein